MVYACRVVEFLQRWSGISRQFDTMEINPSMTAPVFSQPNFNLEDLNQAQRLRFRHQLQTYNLLRKRTCSHTQQFGRIMESECDRGVIILTTVLHLILTTLIPVSGWYLLQLKIEIDGLAGQIKLNSKVILVSNILISSIYYVPFTPSNNDQHSYSW